jgi:hypothetical protein
MVINNEKNIRFSRRLMQGVFATKCLKTKEIIVHP